MTELPDEDGGERPTHGDRVAAGAYLRCFLDEQASRSDGPHGALEALQAFDLLFADRHPHQDVERLTRERDDARRFHTAEHTDRVNAEAEVERLLTELRVIDDNVPSEEHWGRMGDSMWANVGRSAARAVRRVLASSPDQPSEAPE